MRRHLSVLVPVALAAALVSPAGAALKKVPYPEVKVNLDVSTAFKPDAAFNAMRKTLTDAVAKKDSAALFSLIGPNFVWTTESGFVDRFDLGRDALHNFKVAFGFRQPGKDTDGGVDGGPNWEALGAFVGGDSYNLENDNLVCGPITAEVEDDKVLEQARSKIETAKEKANWYYTIADTPVTRTPGDTGSPVATLRKVAVPVLGGFPPSAPSHLEVLLPTGNTGWIAASAARPLESEQLCYAKTPRGEWKIVAYEQPE